MLERFRNWRLERQLISTMLLVWTVGALVSGITSYRSVLKQSHGEMEVQFSLDDLYLGLRAQVANGYMLLLVPLIIFAVLVMLPARRLVVKPLSYIAERLLDFSKMDGLQAMRAIGVLPGLHSAVPVVAMTAHAMCGDRESPLATGMDDYLEKPINRARLGEAVAHWAGIHSPHAQPEQAPAVGVSGTGSATLREHLPESTPDQADAEGGQAADAVDVAVLEQLGRDTSPELVPELVGLFVADARVRIDHLVHALATGDDAVIQHESHALGSSSATYGLPQMHLLARAAEQAIRDQDAEIAYQRAAELTASADRAFAALLAAAGAD